MRWQHGQSGEMRIGQRVAYMYDYGMDVDTGGSVHQDIFRGLIISFQPWPSFQGSL